MIYLIRPVVILPMAERIPSHLLFTVVVFLWRGLSKVPVVSQFCLVIVPDSVKNCFKCHLSDKKEEKKKRKTQSPHCSLSCLQLMGWSGEGTKVCKSHASHPGLITCITPRAYHVRHTQGLSHASHPGLIMCITPRAYHVHHTQGLSRASHPGLITCITPRAYHMHHTQGLSRASHPGLITCITPRAYHVHHTQGLSRASHPGLITCITPRAYHVHHTQGLSRASHPGLIMCNMLSAMFSPAVRLNNKRAGYVMFPLCK